MGPSAMRLILRTAPGVDQGIAQRQPNQQLNTTAVKLLLIAHYSYL